MRMNKNWSFITHFFFCFWHISVFSNLLSIFSIFHFFLEYQSIVAFYEPWIAWHLNSSCFGNMLCDLWYKNATHHCFSMAIVLARWAWHPNGNANLLKILVIFETVIMTERTEAFREYQKSNSLENEFE